MLTVANAAEHASRFIDSIPDYPNGFAGRGVVICAGGPRYLTCSWVAIRMLRHLGCQLPIEVWYLGDDEGDPRWIELVQQFDIECINAFEVAKTHPHPRLGGWESNPYAILHSRFEEVLFLDADNIPVVDPTFLFDCEDYRRTGALFWPDGFHTPAESIRWRIFGVDYRDEPEQESGQLVINKALSWKALQLCNWYNEHSDFFYEHVYGDKDTFRLAWHRVGLPYAMPAHVPEPIPFALVQHGFDGRRLFQHRIHDKWSLHGNYQAADFWYEELCRQFVSELRERWNPLAWATRHLAPADREESLSWANRQFALERVGASCRTIQLGADGYLIRGQNPRCCFWWSEARELVFADINAKPVCRMRRGSDETWSGQAIDKPREAYRLHPSQCI